MKKEELYSPYFHNVVASRKKIFLGSLCDYFLVFILTTVLYTLVGSSILSSLPITKSNNEAMASSNTSLRKIVGETHIQTYNEEEDSLTSVETMAKDYIVALAKTSYYVNGDLLFPVSSTEKVTLSEGDTFLNEENKGYDLNPLAYYFCSFKAQHEELNFYTYDGVDYSSDKKKGLYEYAFGYTSGSYSSFFEEKAKNLSQYETLTLAKAKSITDYLYYGDSGASSVYSALSKAYNNASKKFVEEVESKYQAYINEQARFNEAYGNSTLGYLLTLYLTYALSFVILEIIPVFNKRKVTIGYYVHKLAYAKENETNPKWYQFLLKSLIRFFLYLSSPALLLLLFSQWGLLFYSFGFFRFIYLVAFSLILLLVSNILMLNNKNHQGIAELGSALLLKDTDELEANDPEFAKKENDQHGKQ